MGEDNEEFFFITEFYAQFPEWETALAHLINWHKNVASLSSLSNTQDECAFCKGILENYIVLKLDSGRSDGGHFEESFILD